MVNEKILVVAFDGMDKDLIDRYNLKNILQEEYGRIDNDTEVYGRMTSELFTSFITGETYENHGVRGLSKNLGLKDRLADYLIPRWCLKKVPGFTKLRSVLTSDIVDDNNYYREDIEEETIFDVVEASLPLYVPVYNSEIYWEQGIPHSVASMRGEKRFVEEARHDTAVRLYEGTATQPAFFDVTKDFWDFIMLHLHDPDGFQDTGLGNLEEEYRRLDEIAGDILEEYGDEWNVIFMSDHGRPEQNRGPHEHNKNAFYSCNRELFGDETPHITDFHDKILELVEED
jgi:hypothetical protein